MNFGPLMAKNRTGDFTHPPKILYVSSFLHSMTKTKTGPVLKRSCIMASVGEMSIKLPHRLLGGGGHHVGLPLGVPTFLVWKKIVNYFGVLFHK